MSNVMQLLGKALASALVKRLIPFFSKRKGGQ